MDKLFWLGLFVITGALALHGWLMVFFQYIRGLLSQGKTAQKIIVALVVIEYVLFAFVIYVHLDQPHVCECTAGFQSYGPCDAVVNRTIYLLFFFIFILVSLTSFRHNYFPLYKTSKPKMCGLVLGSVAVVCVYLVYNWGIHSVTLEREKINTIIFLCMLLWTLFTFTLFHGDNKQGFKMIFFTIIPIMLFFVLFYWVEIDFHSLPEGEKVNICRNEG
ncbi:MAG: hypothetical protein ACKOXB_12130 [Flavobacteriales bacterium]